MDKGLIVEPIVVGELATNCYVLGSNKSKEAIVIDPGADSRAIKAVLTRNGLSLNCIILTHGHYDHIGALDDFNVPVYIHADDLEFMKNSSMNLSSSFGLDEKFDAVFRAVKDGENITVTDMEILVIHTPGHTPGGICLQIGAILFSGDTLFRNGIGRTDLPGGSFEQIEHSIKERLFAFNDDIIVFPGHGPATTIKEEKEGNCFL
ncbi:MAG: MBL fold metallo-hydrolase [Candidatus Omnitrophica bacterium]|nr:MBL fold metallo-hydrolase [Candidatus Omnitrophota bacterium]